MATKKSLQQHLDPTTGSKNILSLDGGGIRGALTLGYLKKIETILQEKNGKDYLLCDHFDLIGGTSTGSIIAAGLAKGKSVDELITLYMDLGGKIFSKKFNMLFQFGKRIKADYDHSFLEEELNKEFEKINLGSSEIKTGLCITTKRIDTNSTWYFINHPKGKFFDFNKDILVADALRASAAAPSYFLPKLLNVGNKEIGAFVDGGVSLSNNPALALLQVATLKGFPFRWELGEDKLKIVSVGTGYSVYKESSQNFLGKSKLFWAKNIADFFMQDASWQNQILLQWLSNSPTAQNIDMEIETLKDDFIGGKPLIKYLRYNFPITVNELNGLGLGKTFTNDDVESLVEMSNSENRQLLYKIGEAASSSILQSHFV
jgi:patatin-like phospholipase/acyl hydrolase